MKQKNIYLLYAIALLQGMVFYAPIATLYRQAQGVSVFQITLIESIFLILCLLLELPWGIIADKIGYKHTVIFCCMLYLISKIVFWQATGFFAFLIERIMLSIIFAGLSGVETSMLYLSCKPGGSQRVFSIYNSLQTVGLLASALVFSAVIGNDYKLAGLLTVCSYGLAALLSLGLQEVKPKSNRQSPVREFLSLLRGTLQNKHMLFFLIGVALLSETHQTITVFFNQLQYRKCGLPTSTIGYLYMVVSVAGLCGVFSARITKRFGVAKTVGSLYVAAMAACLLLAVTGNAWLSVAAILVLRIAHSLFQPLQTEIQHQQIQSQNRATALSLNAMIIESAGIGTNVVFGALAECDLPAAFLLGGGLCALGALLFSAWYQQSKRTADQQQC